MYVDVLYKSLKQVGVIVVAQLEGTVASEIGDTRA